MRVARILRKILKAKNLVWHILAVLGCTAGGVLVWLDHSDTGILRGAGLIWIILWCELWYLFGKDGNA